MNVLLEQLEQTLDTIRICISEGYVVTFWLHRPGTVVTGISLDYLLIANGMICWSEVCHGLAKCWLRRALIKC